MLDTINTTLQTYFSCFCKLVISRLNTTNVTSEVLSGDQNSRSCQIQSDPLHVEENMLKDGLGNLSPEFSPKEKEAGMAIILSDQGLTSENFTDIPADREPFLFIVNVWQNESKSRNTCFRQHRFISEMEKINDFGLEIEKIGCDGEFMSLIVIHVHALAENILYWHPQNIFVKWLTLLCIYITCTYL